MLANARLAAGFAADSPAPEHFYDIRAIAVHSWELAQFLRESERDHPEVARFMSTLEDDWKRGYTT
jgi:hypothetical protein